MIRSKPRSYVLRKGRLTSAQQYAITHLWKEYVIENTSEKIDVKILFDNNNPVVADIGFGSGDTLLFLSKSNPEVNFLGVEVYLSGIGSSMARAGIDELKNIRIINKDADLVLKENIYSGSLDGVVLFYPDPWPKRKHHKRRLVQLEFLNSIQASLKKGGFFFCKTDWDDYSNHILKTFSVAKKWEEVLLGDLSCIYQEIPSTTYEKKAIREGRKLKNIVYQTI